MHIHLLIQTCANSISCSFVYAVRYTTMYVDWDIHALLRKYLYISRLTYIYAYMHIYIYLYIYRHKISVHTLVAVSRRLTIWWRWAECPICFWALSVRNKMTLCYFVRNKRSVIQVKANVNYGEICVISCFLVVCQTTNRKHLTRFGCFLSRENVFHLP